MLKGLILFLLQVTFLCLRVINIKQIKTKEAIKASLTSTLIAIVGLAGTYLGIIDGLMQGNYWVILGYILGAGVGTFIGMKI